MSARGAYRTARRLLRRDRGQSLVEFAIVVPLLLALLVAIFEFGRAWNIQQVVTNVAREGARQGVLATVDNDSVQTVVSTLLTTARLDPADATVSVNGCNDITGTECNVQIQYPYNFLFMGPVVRLISGGAWPGSVTLGTTSIMRNE